MNAKPPNPRTPDWDIDSMFTDRWSPRAFASDPLSDREIQTLFEAARWAPSCYNEQPWLFVYATEPNQRAKLASCLVAKNQAWAGRAPLLMFILARRNFQKTGKENRHAPYDAGAAWMALALQGSLLVRFGDPAVADAFCATRLERDWGNVFGTLPAGVGTAAIIERHAVRI